MSAYESDRVKKLYSPLAETRFSAVVTNLENLSRIAELVDLKVDVIVTWTTPGTLAAKHGTKTIPIVAG